MFKKYTKYLLASLLGLVALFAFPVQAQAQVGDMSFFGGISE